MPRISAVMALYNTPYELLKATVESLLKQTFADFELIIIDDASKTEYKSFFESFKDERIKYFKLEKNSGPGNARNEGIKKAVGEYVAIVDSDDVYLPERFEKQAEFLDNNPEISLISCRLKQSNNGKISTVAESNEDIKLLMLFNSPLANPAVMFRRNLFVEKNLFYPENKNFGEDYELWINAMFSGVKMANQKDVLMIYTRRKGQLSTAKSDLQVVILKDLYKKILSHIGISATESELDLHYALYTGDFAAYDSDRISGWFDKIIEHNKSAKIFDEPKLIIKKNRIIEQHKRIKNRLFKIKIGNKNLCLSKTMQIYLESRN